MPSGIEVYNADGTLQFDAGIRLLRTLSVQTAGTYGSVTIPGASSQGTVVASVVLQNESDDAPPMATVSGDTVSWGLGPSSIVNVMVY